MSKLNLGPLAKEFESFAHKVLEKLDIEEILDRLDFIGKDLKANDELFMAIGKQLMGVDERLKKLEVKNGQSA